MNTYTINPHIPSHIFRAYDIRGTIETELTEDNVYTIARAIATAMHEKNQKQVIVARDGRLSGPRLAQALIQGLQKGGCEVTDIGSVPTPLLYFATHHLKIANGIMLTGSHNPVNYNGLKIIIAGIGLAEQEISALYKDIVNKNFKASSGTYVEQSIISAYLEKITSTIRLARPLKVVIDCGNGITGKVAPLLFRQLACEVIELYSEVDGRFPYHHPDPSQPENLQDLIQRVRSEKADLGLAFDGDGDRLGIVAETGEIIYPDRLLMLFAEDLLKRHSGATIIYDVKCTRHLKKIISEAGGHSLLWKTGHSLIKKKLRETGALLAGEMSGHFFFKERWFGFDDGLYAAARLLEIVAQDSKDLSTYFERLPHDISTPEIICPIPDEYKFTFIEKLIEKGIFPKGEKITLDGLRVEFAEGWGLVRGSNTMPALILRFEAETQAALNEIKHNFKTEMKKVEPSLKLDF